MITRRATLLGLTTAAALGGTRLAFAHAATERRFVVVLLRGGLDGLAAVVPHGDPALAAQRGPLVPAGLLDLGGFWGLHPALAQVHAMIAGGQGLAFQAVAGPDRSRSHFAAQDTMELGVSGYGIASGWLNRAAAQVGGPQPALALAAVPPLLLRGPAAVATWLPSSPTHPPPDFYAAVAALNRDDPLTGPAISEALAARGFDAAVLAGTAPPPQRHPFVIFADAAGHLLAAPDGPRIAALEQGGWDTHMDQAPRLAPVLGALDDGLAALRDALGPAWQQTAVLVVTEFGRTVRPNGSLGTDHGTATIALLLGGAVRGGRVVADWPGLADAKLFERRDLQPTLDVRAVAKGVLARHLGLDAQALARVFPGSERIAPVNGLVWA